MTRSVACTHHWLLGDPTPEHTQIGRCVHCNEEREFQVDSPNWNGRAEEGEQELERVQREVWP